MMICRNSYWNMMDLRRRILSSIGSSQMGNTSRTRENSLRPLKVNEHAISTPSLCPEEMWIFVVSDFLLEDTWEILLELLRGPVLSWTILSVNKRIEKSNFHIYTAFKLRLNYVSCSYLFKHLLTLRSINYLNRTAERIYILRKYCDIRYFWNYEIIIYRIIENDVSNSTNLLIKIVSISSEGTVHL